MADADPNRKAVIQTHYQSVRFRIAEAARRSGRTAESVRLIAVTKGHDIDEIMALYDAGAREFGENRIQESLPKIASLPKDIGWHLIGHLQRNKSKSALQSFELIHSLDSIRLGRELQKQADNLGRPARVLLEVNVSGEESKYGFRPEDVGDVLTAAREWPRVQVTGLMTMAPYEAKAEATRPVFRQLRELRDALRGSMESARNLAELSMGMTNDFEVAIEEGATMVRIGSALFAP